MRLLAALLLGLLVVGCNPTPTTLAPPGGVSGDCASGEVFRVDGGCQQP